jgi:hypothetical protein
MVRLVASISLWIVVAAQPATHCAAIAWNSAAWDAVAVMSTSTPPEAEVVTAK